MSTKPNIALLIFDIIFLPIIIIRLILIYFFGSKYNIQGMGFLDVMFHASQPYFNQEVGVTIDSLHEDVTATVKRETKLFIEKIEPIKSIESIEQIVTKPKKIVAKKYEPKEISIKSDDSENTSDSEQEKTENIENNNSKETSETESEQILDTYTDESHATTEAKTDLDVHIDQLFDDLKNSITTTG